MAGNPKGQSGGRSSQPTTNSYLPDRASSSSGPPQQHSFQDRSGSSSFRGSKRKLIHMNDAQCLSHSKSLSGVRPLTNPNPQGLAKRPQMDVNRGLYPRQPLNRTHQAPFESRGGHSVGRSQKSSPMKQTLMTTFVSCSSPEKLPSPPHASTRPQPIHQVGFINQLSSKSGGSFSSSGSHGPSTSYSCRNMTFNHPAKPSQKTPTKSPCHASWHSPQNRNTSSTRLYDPRSQAKSPVRSLFQRKVSRKSADFIKEFEDDDSITPEMFDDLVGSCERTQSIGISNQNSTSIEKDFEDDDSFTTDEFDDVLQSSQGSIDSKKKDVEEQTYSFEKNFEDEDLFSEVLQSSQGSLNARDNEYTERGKKGDMSIPGNKLGKMPTSHQNLEEEFENDDLFTADEFDEVLQSSQGLLNARNNADDKKGSSIEATKVNEMPL